MARRFCGWTAKTMTPPAMARQRPCGRCGILQNPMSPKTDKPKPKKTAARNQATTIGNEAQVLDAEMEEGLAESGFYNSIRHHRHPHEEATVTPLLGKISEQRVKALAESVATYITANLPKAISKRKGLAGYRTSPYVLLTSANVMHL